MRCEESPGEVPAGRTAEASLGGRLSVADQKPWNCIPFWFLGTARLQVPCTDLLASLSVSERHFWVVPYPRPFLSHLKGQTLVCAQFFPTKKLAIHLFGE